jgi:hypothetical protein
MRTRTQRGTNRALPRVNMERREMDRSRSVPPPKRSRCPPTGRDTSTGRDTPSHPLTDERRLGAAPG